MDEMTFAMSMGHRKNAMSMVSNWGYNPKKNNEMFSIYYTVLVNQLHPSKYILSMYQKLISMNMSGGQNYYP